MESHVPSSLIQPSVSPESSTTIKNNVQQIISFCLKRENTEFRKKDLAEYKQMCMRQFTSFFEKYPTLFFSIIENPSTFPLYRLDEMLILKSKIESKDIDEHGASVQLGQKYFDEFVKETVGVLDKQLKK